MAPGDSTLSFSVTAVVEDIIQQHGGRINDNDLASRKAEQAASRRYEATEWLRKMVGAVGAKDLPAEPTEEEFRMGLRSGIILCNALNKVQIGAIPKVVEIPGDSAPPPHGAALTAYQYFENMRNFLDAVDDMGLPTFEASDLNQGGNSTKVVNCILALKSYSDWKQAGGRGVWKYSGNLRPSSSGKCFVRKNSEAFMNSLSRAQSLNGRYMDGLPSEQNQNREQLTTDISETNDSRSLDELVRSALSDKGPEEIPSVVESMLRNVMEEFERRVASQDAITAKDCILDDNKASQECQMDIQGKAASLKLEQCPKGSSTLNKGSKLNELKQKACLDHHQKEIQALRKILVSTKADMQFMQTKSNEDWAILGKQMSHLAHAASSYRRLLEENRKLYNQVQDLKGSIRVYCRVKPFLSNQHFVSSVDNIDEGTITILTPSKYGKDGRRTFSFNKVFGPSVTQADVFADTQPLIRSVLDGYNVCIFAYGQTGSGKTYTMSGPRDVSEDTRGVNFRALSDLFQLSAERRDYFSYEVCVQMIEIYNEQVRDLLATDVSLHKRLEIRNSSQKGLNVPEANLVPVSSTSDILELMDIGQKNRAVGSTALNDRSSRSHSCLTVHVQGREITSDTIFRGSMHLVDLAGSERVDKSEVTGERLKEAQHINKSLSALGDVIAALAQKNSHVPYRNSKLTQLLQDALGGQAKTLMFVHINPDSDAIGETISTLKFAERVATVELGAARVNKDSGDVKELKEQIVALKVALAAKEVEEQAPCPPLSPDPCKVKARGPSSTHGDTENMRATMSNPDISRTKPRGVSPVPFNGQSKEQRCLRSMATSPDVIRTKTRVLAHGGSDMIGSRSKQRQPMEEVGNIENTALRQTRPNGDLQEFLSASSNSLLWPDESPLASQKEEERETASGEWVDKVMVNKQEPNGAEHPLKHWQGGGSLPNLCSQNYLPDGMNCESRSDGHIAEMGGTDDSDELEVGTSDSSEAADATWLVSIPNKTGLPASPIQNVKKASRKGVKGSLESRSVGVVGARKPTMRSQSFIRTPGRLPLSTSERPCLSSGKRGKGKS